MSIQLNGDAFQDLFDNYNYSYNYNETDLENIFSETAPCMKAWSLNKYSVAVVYSVVVMLSVAGNSMVVLVICYDKVHRSSTDIYLLNLAIADLLIAITLPFWAAYIVSQWIFGEFMCKATSVLQEVNFYSGILLLACISVDRYLAIVRATETVVQKRHLVKFVCIGVWVFAILLSLPILLYRSVFNSAHGGSLVCYELLDASKTERWRIITRFLRHIIGFFIPLIIMIFCYGFTLNTLLEMKGKQKQRAMRVIFAVVLSFLICWLPFNITVFIDTLMRTKAINETCNLRAQIDTALPVTQMLGFSHSCINPILYAFIGQKFRHSFLKILTTHGVISKDILIKRGRSPSSMSTSGNTSTTL
ncbi:C-X-C chemokine receptor type 2-like [Protopterus annectens]|uniref:C-X-C chemokine receptor type 2-like n=1 Tax=Protopterus annectens TaxID=7888 RepID=UPI001CFC324B|nr:C-X-C chemokine receptor type 2-like [Protopterus annectens]